VQVVTPPEGAVMTEATNKVPVKTEKTTRSPQGRRPFGGLRREINSLYERAAFGAIPAVHVTETDKAYALPNCPAAWARKMSR
jgi:hypothetical protein